MVERTGEQTGEVVFAKPNALDPGDARCGRIASCIAREFLGKELPAAAGLGDELVFRHRGVAKASPEYMSDPDHLERVAEVLAEDLSRAIDTMDVATTEDGRLYYNFLKQRRLVECVRSHREGPGCCP